MKQVWKRISALLLACAVLAALIPAALAGNSSEAYKIAVSAAPAVVTAGSTTIVSATVYSCDEADGEWSEYLGRRRGYHLGSLPRGGSRIPRRK